VLMKWRIDASWIAKCAGLLKVLYAKKDEDVCLLD